jgi:RNA polymerase-binding transcription factor DksA
LTEFDEQQVKQRLQARAEEIATARANLSAAAPDTELADYDQHPADEGTETHDQELDETREMLLADEADRVRQAMQRVESGDYGKCVDCGKDIPAARLEAVPESIRCVEDQQRYEGTLRARWPPPQRDITP